MPYSIPAGEVDKFQAQFATATFSATSLVSGDTAPDMNTLNWFLDIEVASGAHLRI